MKVDYFNKLNRRCVSKDTYLVNREVVNLFVNTVRELPDKDLIAFREKPIFFDELFDIEHRQELKKIEGKIMTMRNLKRTVDVLDEESEQVMLECIYILDPSQVALSELESVMLNTKNELMERIPEWRNAGYKINVEAEAKYLRGTVPASVLLELGSTPRVMSNVSLVLDPCIFVMPETKNGVNFRFDDVDIYPVMTDKRKQRITSAGHVQIPFSGKGSGEYTYYLRWYVDEEKEIAEYKVTVFKKEYNILPFIVTDVEDFNELKRMFKDDIKIDGIDDRNSKLGNRIIHTFQAYHYNPIDGTHKPECRGIDKTDILDGIYNLERGYVPAGETILFGENLKTEFYKTVAGSTKMYKRRQKLTEGFKQKLMPDSVPEVGKRTMKNSAKHVLLSTTEPNPMDYVFVMSFKERELSDEQEMRVSDRLKTIEEMEYRDPLGGSRTGKYSVVNPQVKIHSMCELEPNIWR